MKVLGKIKVADEAGAPVLHAEIRNLESLPDFERGPKLSKFK